MRQKKIRIIGGVTFTKCSRCKKFMRNDSFYRNKKASNGLQSQCKKCHGIVNITSRDEINKRKTNREHMRRARKTNPEKFKLREKIASRKREQTPASGARSKLNSALRSGKVVKPSRCENCNRNLKLTAHHEDYTKPLEVEWLCYECHGETTWIR